MKSTMLKRLLSFVMVLAMVTSYVVMPAAAETADSELGHTHTHVAGEPVAPTCTADGYTTYVCGCGDRYTADVVTAAGHSYENGICSACGEVDPNYVAPLNEECDHVWDDGITTAATCTASGSTVYTCTVEDCGETKTDTIDATGHNFEEGVCTLCGDPDPDSVPTCEHVWGEGVTTAATCTASGSTVYTCTVEGCGETKADTIDATGHNFEEGVCTLCGDPDPDSVPTCEHVWGEGVTTAATCTASGSTVYTCTVEGCGETKTDTIDAKGHSFEKGICTACGEAEPVCSCTVRCAETVNADCPVCSVEGGICAVEEEEESAPEMPKALYFSDQDKTWGEEVTIVYVDAEGNETRQTMLWAERGYFYASEVSVGTVSFYFTDGVNNTQPQSIETVLTEGWDMCVIFDGETEWMEYAIWEQMVPNTIDLTQDSHTIETAGEDYVVSAYTGGNTLTIKANATVTLQGVNITATEGASAISIESGNVTLIVENDSTLTGGKGGAGIYVAEGASVTIKGDGCLNAIGNGGADTSDSGAAGIGGTWTNGNSGAITINGATVVAKGYGVHGSGIGSGSGQVVGEIKIINGAKVTAYGGYYANGEGTKLKDKYGDSDPEGGAAIGGGGKTLSTIANITITGSNVTAYGGSKAAGIGANFWSNCGTINITNSTVVAQGGSSSAGIGTSRIAEQSSDNTAYYSGAEGTISITGGTVTAVGGDYGAGIGSGYNAESLGNKAENPVLPAMNITINSGTVNATGGMGGAGIGGGYKSNNLNINIVGGDVTATAGDLVNGKTVESGGPACGIGSGANGSGTFNGSTISIADSASVTAKSYYGGKDPIEGFASKNNITVEYLNPDAVPAPDLNFTDAVGNESGEGWNWNHASKTLTLNGIDYSSDADDLIKVPDGSTIVLNGENKIATTATGVNGIYAKGAVTINGEGSLNITLGSGNAIYAEKAGGNAIITIEDATLTANGGIATADTAVNTSLILNGADVNVGRNSISIRNDNGTRGEAGTAGTATISMTNSKLYTGPVFVGAHVSSNHSYTRSSAVFSMNGSSIDIQGGGKAAMIFAWGDCGVDFDIVNSNVKIWNSGWEYTDIEVMGGNDHYGVTGENGVALDVNIQNSNLDMYGYWSGLSVKRYYSDNATINFNMDESTISTMTKYGSAGITIHESTATGTTTKNITDSITFLTNDPGHSGTNMEVNATIYGNPTLHQNFTILHQTGGTHDFSSVDYDFVLGENQVITIGAGKTFTSAKAITMNPGSSIKGNYVGDVIVPDGYEAIVTGEGDSQVITCEMKDMVAENTTTGKKYTSLQKALNEAVNGQTVKLLASLSYDADDIVYAHGGGTGFGTYDQDNPCIIYTGGTKGADGAANQASTVNAILDLNSHSITSSADAYLFVLMDNTKLTFTDSIGGGGITNTSKMPVIWAVGTDTQVTIDRGTYTTANDEGLLWSTHGADMVINGGEFKTTAEDSSLLIVRNEQDWNNPSNFVDGNATITVNGGTFHGFNPENIPDDATTPFTYFNGVSEGKCAADNNGAFTVGVNKMSELISESNADCFKPAMKAHYVCEYCGRTYEENQHKLEADDVTVGDPLCHEFTGDWDYDEENGAAGHYQWCIRDCGTKSELENHRWSEWERANTRSTVQETRYCLDCGYLDDPRSVHVHDYIIGGYTEASHELICNDTNCNKDADAKKTVNHDLTIDSNNDGQLDKCICGYSTAKHVHNLVWKHNSSKHWQECTSKDGLACDHKEVKENHVWGSWENGKADGSSKASWCHKECKTCGYIIERHVIWSYSDNPKTGDYIAIAFGVMFISAAALVILLVVKKKRR